MKKLFIFFRDWSVQDEETLARVNLDLKENFTEHELLQKFKQKVTKDPGSMPSLTKHTLILLKKKYCVKDGFERTSEHDNLYQEMLHSSILEEHNKITFKLQNFDSLTHQKFYNEVQTVCKISGSKVMKSEFQIKLNDIKFPYSRTILDLPSVEILGVSKTRNLMEISISGDSVMIIVLFYLKSILKTFLQNIKNVQPNRLWDPTSDEDLLYEDKLEIGSAKKREIDDDSNEDTDIIRKKRKIPNEEENDLEEESVQNVLTKDDIGHKSTIATAMDLEEGSVLNVEAEDIIGSKDTFNLATVELSDSEGDSEPFSMQCYYCALCSIAENIDLLLHTDNYQIQLECVGKCIDVEDSFKLFAQSFSAMICSEEIGEDAIENVHNNINIIFENVIDPSKYSRADLFCKLLEYMETVVQSKQHRIVSLLREICDILIGTDCKLLENTLKLNKKAKRNIVKFMFNTGHFFSLQALVEIFNIMYRNGVDIKSILPRNLSPAIEQFSAAPVPASSEYFSFMAKVTQDIVINILNSQNISIIEAERIVFKHGSGDIEKRGDQHVYINKIDNVLYHFLQPNQSQMVVCEEIEFHKLSFDLKSKVISTEYWNFFLPQSINLDWTVLLNSDDQINKKTVPDQQSENTKVEAALDISVEDMNISAELGESNEKSISGSSREESKEQSIEKQTNTFNDVNQQNKENNQNKNKISKDATIETKLIIPVKNVSKYWSEKSRSFIRSLCGEDWPQAYGSPCPVVFQYSHVKKFKSAKRTNHFAKMIGNCKVCSAVHTCVIQESPFLETLENEQIKYKPKTDLNINVSVTGNFDLKSDGSPDIRKPVHNLNKATGLFLKGQERQIIGEKVSKEGVQKVYMEQFDNANDEQVKMGNKTTIKSYDVLMMARQEQERKQRNES